MKRNADLNPGPTTAAPSPNGRTPRGQFAKGNEGGPGNPYAKRVAALRSALLESVTEADIRAVARALVKRAKEGDVPAVRELLDRLLGKRDPTGPQVMGPPIIKVVTGLPDDPVELTPEECERAGVELIRVITNVPRSEEEG